MIKNPYNKYQKTNIETSSPQKLVLILYDGALRFIREAKKLLEEENFTEAFHKILRAENIVVELISSLNFDAGGEIANNFMQLYKFVNKRLVEANSERDIKKLEEAEIILSDIRDIWIEVIKKAEELPKADLETTNGINLTAGASKKSGNYGYGTNVGSGGAINITK